MSFSAPITSHEAADANDVTASQAFVHYLFTVHGPMADFQLLWWAAKFVTDHDDAIEFSDSRLRSARHELTEQGVVEHNGGYTTRPRPAKQARHQVWQLVDNRRAAAQATPEAIAA